jgi:hypothetical protein
MADEQGAGILPSGPFTWAELEAKGFSPDNVERSFDEQVGDIADYGDDDEDPHGHGKRLPYVGWFWRDPYWIDSRLGVVLGDCGEFIGVMMSNKWGYPGRSMTPEEATEFRSRLDTAFTQLRGGDKPAFETTCSGIWDWMQGLRDVGVWSRDN